MPAENRGWFRRGWIRPRFCLSRKNATLDKFRNKRKVGCALLYGDDCHAGMGGCRNEKRRKSRGYRGRPTEKGWNRGRTINLTIYPLRRGRGVRSEEAQEWWSASCCLRRLWTTEYVLICFLHGDNLSAIKCINIVPRLNYRDFT